MARTYKRDARGRFSGGGGGSSGGGGKKAASKPSVTGKGPGMGGTRKGPDLNRDVGQTSNPRGTVAAGSFNSRSSVNKRIKASSPANASGKERRMNARTFGEGAGTTVKAAAPKASRKKAQSAKAATPKKAPAAKKPTKSAKEQYKELSSKKRRLTNRLTSVEFAGERSANTRALNKLVKNRGVSTSRKRK